MGLFSYGCLVCGRDLMSDYSSKDAPRWMKNVVVFMPDGLKIAGKYTGAGCVETPETLWSSYVDRKGTENDNYSGISLIQINSERFFVSEKCDTDRGYLHMHVWEDLYVYNPCCYHRACWEAVGEPEGYRGSSIPAISQGSGIAARLHGVENFDNIHLMDDDDDVGPIIGRPMPGPEAMGLWIANSITHFLHALAAWTGWLQQAQDQRDMWKNMEDMEERLREYHAMIDEDEKS